MIKKIKVLMINTDNSLRTFLSEEMFDFIMVSDPRDFAVSAIAICAENKDIDICLVNGYIGHMAGFEAAESIKQIRPNLPMICMSELDIPQQYKQYFIAHFKNAINLDKLLSTIKEHTS